MPVVKALEMVLKHGKSSPERIAIEEGLEIINTDAITTIEGFMADNCIFLRLGIGLARRQWMIANYLGHYLLGHKHDSPENSGRATDFALALHSLTVVCNGDNYSLVKV